MVYVKRVELSRFKSFGGSNAVPFLPGFTVISGPNGSGKSNILDLVLTNNDNMISRVEVKGGS